jgi:large subunit ribosomal protein L11
MAKKIKAVVRLQLPAGQATPAPPVGPALAPHGVNTGEFCKAFNDATKDQKGWVIPVVVTVFEDRTYVFKIKQPTVAEFLKKAVGIEKGSGQPNKIKVGKITRTQLKEIAKKKLPDLNTTDLEAALRIVEGTAKNMGLEIID